MQMVMCDKCRKPIDHTHKYRIVMVGDGPHLIQHVNCNAPVVEDTEGKVLPAFAYESPQKRAV